MSRDPKFIPKDTLLDPALDFEFLRKTGIAYAQQLAGQNWTDYNDHDPGVTILEQLAFAITELAYRTNLDIKDLISSQEQPSGENGKNTSPFFTAFDILTTNPVTFYDLRKLIIDRVKGVDNLWILPLDQQSSDSGIRGNYLALVKTSDNSSDPRSVAEEVWEQLHRCRNFGELCQEVILLKEQEVYMKADIELLPNADAQKVHARIIFELEKYLSAPIPFYSLHEMMNMSLDVSDIFDSPRLYNGYILDASLRRKQSIVNNNELVNIIRGVEGVKSIKYFNTLQEITDPNGNTVYQDYYDELSDRTVRDQLIIARDKVAVLGKKILEDANHPAFFRYYRDDMQVSLFQREVDRYYKEFQSRVVFRYRKNFDQANNLPVPEGRKRNLREYHSIQHHFPQVYGLGTSGIPNNFSEERKTFVYQLKGYLLLFEQLLADYLMQLARFNELFSLDEHLDQSYFSQVPWSIPDIHRLLAGLETGTNPKTIEEHFNAIVSTLNRAMDNFYDRRSRFMDHLYARFGDQEELRFDQFKYYASREIHQKEQLSHKIRALKYYPVLTRNKSRSFNPRKRYWNKKNYSALEHRIRILLGLDRPAQPVAHRLKPGVHFGLRPEPEHLSEIVRKHRHLKADGITTQLTGIAKYQKELADSTHFELTERIRIDESLFRRGIWEDNLSVLTSSEDHPYGHLLLYKRQAEEEKPDSDLISRFTRMTGIQLTHSSRFKLLLSSSTRPLYLIEFEPAGPEVVVIKSLWNVLAEYSTDMEAFTAAFSLKNRLLRLNQESEGLYLIDHALLQPRHPNNRYKIQFGTEDKSLIFQLQKPLGFHGIQSKIIRDVQKLRRSTFKVVKNKAGQYLAAAYFGKILLGRSLHTFANAVEAKEEIPLLQDYFAKLTDLDIQNEQKVRIDHCRVYPEQDPEDYNFTISVFFSGWTARFFDPEFRYQVEVLIRKYTPAHIALQFNWLKLPAMLAFEHLFNRWLAKYRQTEQFREAGKSFPEFDVTEELNETAYHLMDFIKHNFSVDSMKDWRQFKDRINTTL